MPAQQTTATERSTASTVTEEDTLRAYNRLWRDTAYGRATHYEICPLASHRSCGSAA